MGYPVCVIDDGSTDNTSEIAKQKGADVIVHDVNKGKGASIREGFRYAIDTRCTALIIMDGDGQHTPGDIQSFIEKYDATNADIIVGNRMTDTKNMPLIRFLTNKFMSFLVSTVARQRIPDTQCGFRFIKRCVLEKVRLDSSNYDAESELLIKAAFAGFSIESAVIQTIYGAEESKIDRIKDTVRFFALIIKSVQWQRESDDG